MARTRTTRTRRTPRADRTYYAWSNIRIQDPKQIGAMTTLKPGTEVSPGMFTSEDEYKNLIEVGSIRPTEYPETRSDESPRRAALRAIREMQRELDEGYNPDAYDQDEDEDEDEVVVVEDEDVDEDDTATS